MRHIGAPFAYRACGPGGVQRAFSLAGCWSAHAPCTPACRDVRRASILVGARDCTQCMPYTVPSLVSPTVSERACAAFVGPSGDCMGCGVAPGPAKPPRQCGVRVGRAADHRSSLPLPPCLVAPTPPRVGGGRRRRRGCRWRAPSARCLSANVPGHGSQRLRAYACAPASLLVLVLLFFARGRIRPSSTRTVSTGGWVKAAAHTPLAGVPAGCTMCNQAAPSAPAPRRAAPRRRRVRPAPLQSLPAACAATPWQPEGAPGARPRRRRHGCTRPPGRCHCDHRVNAPGASETARAALKASMPPRQSTNTITYAPSVHHHRASTQHPAPRAACSRR